MQAAGKMNSCLMATVSLWKLVAQQCEYTYNTGTICLKIVKMVNFVLCVLTQFLSINNEIFSYNGLNL